MLYLVDLALKRAILKTNLISVVCPVALDVALGFNM